MRLVIRPLHTVYSMCFMQGGETDVSVHSDVDDGRQSGK